jgi:ergothioneine biosynthesis protein EgtB
MTISRTMQTDDPMALDQLAERFRLARTYSEHLAAPLATEDFVVQAMPDASPTSWHLAHTTWFFETFLLARWEPGYRPINADYQVLFNSYYNSVGEQFPRPRRGMLTRPTVAEVFSYRQEVDRRVSQLLSKLKGDEARAAAEIVELGINHEQQHQELILTDLKYLYSCNPLLPIYLRAETRDVDSTFEPRWTSFEGGIVEIGHAGHGFSFDNERPRHRVLIATYQLRSRLVTNGEYLQFIDDGGYSRPELWLSLGWATKNEQKWTAPLYWLKRDGAWHEFTLHGLRPLVEAEPVCHLSYFEADAFARWSGVRLPTEFEWEHAAQAAAADDHRTGKMPVPPETADAHYHPQRADHGRDGLAQLDGDVWQWTSSSYGPYPGFATAEGALGEYNGKFMCNQYVLRGGSCATPASHTRATYRNFFPPEARWQFTGLRLARDV